MLIEQVAACPRGLEVFRDAAEESAAISLGVHPFVVAAARTFVLETLGWTAFEEALRQAGSASPTAVVRVAESAEAEALLKSAGPEAVRRGTAAEAAAALGVHPYVVHRARETLERRSVRRHAQSRVDPALPS